MAEGNESTRKSRFGGPPVKRGNIRPIEPPPSPPRQVEHSGQPVERSGSQRPAHTAPPPPQQQTEEAPKSKVFSLEAQLQEVIEKRNAKKQSTQDAPTLKPMHTAPPPPHTAQASSQNAGHSGQPVAHSSGKKHQAPMPPQAARASSQKVEHSGQPVAHSSGKKHRAPMPPQTAQASNQKPVRPAPQPPGQQTGQAPAAGQGSLADALRKALDERNSSQEQSNAKPRSNSFQSHDLDKLAQQIQNVLNETGVKGNKSNAKGSELGYGMDSNAQGSATPPGNAQSVASNKGGNRGRG